MRAWTGVAMSSDGKIQTAIADADYVYVSTDYGNTWTAKDAERNWYDVAMSSDGKYQTATAYSGEDDYIYVSTDYGSTWTPKGSIQRWWGIAMSSDGKYQTVGRGFIEAPVYIYVSTDYGNTWTAKGDPEDGWAGIAMSSDGKVQTAVPFNNGYIYLSTDYGNTWTAKDEERNWTGVAMSSDGKIQTAAVSGGQIYLSTDYGNTWTAKSAASSWLGVAMSSDGKIQTAVTDGNYIYISSADSYIPLGNVGIGTTNPIAKLTVSGDIVSGNILPTFASSITATTRTNTQISDTDSVGSGTSIAIGTDSLPIISHYNFTDGDLMITKCGNSACSSGNTTTQISDDDSVGDDNSIAIGNDGLPIISYGNDDDTDLMITKCGNSACSSGNTTTQITDTDIIGYDTSIAIGNDGLPIISYGNSTDDDLMITKCGNSACYSGNTTTQISDGDNVGGFTSIAIGTDGLPIISYYNQSDGDLMITKCGNSACSSGNTTTQITDTDIIGYGTSIAIGNDGLPIISYGNSTDDDLMITKCGNSACSSGNTTIQISDGDNVGDDNSIAIGTTVCRLFLITIPPMAT